MTNRPATMTDLEAVIELTRRQRQRLAEWSPVYFNPRENADEGHAGWLAFLVESADFDTRVLVDDDTVLGFHHVITQASRIWVDDLCVVDDGQWPKAALELRTVPAPWVACVARADVAQAAGLRSIGASPVSTFHAATLPTPAASAGSNADVPTISHFEPWSVQHSFAEQPFNPSMPGALVVVDADGGYAIGSPSANPPIYDPGGSTCVVDTIRGDDRAGLLALAMRSAAARGDAQMIVVCDSADGPLGEILAAAGFEPVVDMFAYSRSSADG